MNIWDQLVDCICRPPRDVYSPSELLGGSNQTFMVGSMECTRLDFELTNKQGQKLQCSHYLPLEAKSQDDKLPVVVYCHCNSGSRRDAEEAIYHLLPCGVGVVAFDFAGSGLSDGKWVTLGAHEVEDLRVVVQHLREQGGVSSIGLWGRSMGAVTALLYSHTDPNIAGMVLDSPFSRLTDLMLEIVVSQKLPIPKMMLKLALRLMRNSVRRKAGCDINSVSPLDVVARSAIPAMFGHGEEDTFIAFHHSVKLYEAYNTAADTPVYKNLVRFGGDHNHPRPSFFYSSVCCFFHQQLKLDQVLLGGNPADTQQLMQYGSLSLSSAADQLDRANGFINTPWSLEPVSSMSHEQQAAAAAAATALLLEEGAVSNGAGSSSGAGSDGSQLQRAPGVLHRSEAGLNSPRAAAAAAQNRALLLLAAEGGSSGSKSSSGRMDGHHVHGSSGPGSPTSPMHHPMRLQQHHRQLQIQQHHRHHHVGLHSTHRQQQLQQQQLAAYSSLEQLEDNGGPSARQQLQQQQTQPQQPQMGSAAAAADARGQASASNTQAMAVPSSSRTAGRHSNEELFSVGSRGAHTLSAPTPGDTEGPTAAVGGTSAAAAAAGSAGAVAGVVAGGSGRSAGAVGTDSTSSSSACAEAETTAVGRAGKEGVGQHLRWLFKRNSSGSSAAGSTPSTSPPVASGGAELGLKPAAAAATAAAAAAASATAAAVQPSAQQQRRWQGAPLPQQQHQQPAGVHAPQAVSGVAGSGAMEGDVGDLDLAAAIAASLSDSQQQQQQRAVQQPPQQQEPGQQQGHVHCVPHSVQEEEQMVREAIALSLGISAPPAQQQAQAAAASSEQRQQQPGLDPQQQQQPLPQAQPLPLQQQQQQQRQDEGSLLSQTQPQQQGAADVVDVLTQSPQPHGTQEARTHNSPVQQSDIV